ncbi:hypothetical protein VaNZ11_009299 [Volvox africanus]|uniref:Transmembrane protein n=1 Tax=Volvox africanus TaxID=51714 RepID=A0ABQ5S8N2_9CHLO|nr:hypothetical protein VaNZ11_009299 [Volvox africanus]
MDKSTIGLLSIFVVASCTVKFASASPGFPGGRRFLQEAASLRQFLESLIGLSPDNYTRFDSNAQAWIVTGNRSLKAVPPPPVVLYGRGPVSPATAAVGLMLGGCAAGLFLMALSIWMKNYVTWDFNLKDLIMVALGRHRQMAVVPRDSLPRDEAGEAATATVTTTAVQDADQGDVVLGAAGSPGTPARRQQQQQQEEQPGQQEQPERGLDVAARSSEGRRHGLEEGQEWRGWAGGSGASGGRYGEAGASRELLRTAGRDGGGARLRQGSIVPLGAWEEGP